MISKRNALTWIGGIAITLAVTTGAGPAETTAQAACDPNYAPTPGGCVYGDRDYDCPELHARGIGDIPVIGTDWQRLDGYFDYDTGQWRSWPDGVGCEWGGE
jgi:hypothetical protein